MSFERGYQAADGAYIQERPAGRWAVEIVIDAPTKEALVNAQLSYTASWPTEGYDTKWTDVGLKHPSGRFTARGSRWHTCD